VATWNTNNIVLTTRGQEILSKVQAGGSAMTVVRVVTGSGRVAESALYSQTAVTNIQQEMTIIKKTTTSSGSSLEVQVNNTGLLTEYNLSQIGIYVTHPDYTGEQLYVITQCDSGTEDQIPLPEETPVTLNFSMFMEHSGTTNVTITVDPAGTVDVVTYNAHVADTDVHFANLTEKNAFAKKPTVGTVKPTDGSLWFEVTG
jgi:hypothetical protein